MKIGIDASRAFLSERTGTEEYSYQLIKALAKIDRKNEYTLYVKDRVYPLSDPVRRGESKGSITQGKLAQAVRKWAYPDNFQFKTIPWSRLWTQAGLALECLKNPPDILFIPAHTMPILRRPGLKTVVTIHDLGAEFLPEYHQFPQKLYLNKSTEYAVSQATHLIAVSKATKKDLITKLHCDPLKVSVIYEGYDGEIFNFAELKTRAFLKTSLARHAELGSASREIPKQVRNDGFEIASREIRKRYGINGEYILFVGTVQPRKNLERLIEAFARLCSYSLNEVETSTESKGNIKVGLRPASQRGEQAQAISGSGSNKGLSLLIVGKPGWMCEKIYAAPEEFGVAGKVNFLNYVPKEDLPFLYQNALCFVLPSLYEGFGLPVIEAMACGCPVIASKTSSLPEVVGAAGLLVDPYDTDDIAKNLQLLISDLQLKKTLVKKGFEQVKKFSWEKCARETLRVLEKI